MILVILAVLCFVAAAILPTVIPEKTPKELKAVSSAACVLLGIFCLLATSWTIIDSDKVGHLKRTYMGDNMAPGQIIAKAGQKGPQAEILPPGFQFRFLLNVLYDVEELELVEIPDGKYGYLIAKDGVPLKKGEFLAPAWKESDVQKMLDAEYFLNNGGQKGPQTTVIKPGKYRLNTYLWDYKIGDATDIAAGFVGVIKSNIQEISDNECSNVQMVEPIKVATEEPKDAKGKKVAKKAVKKPVVVAKVDKGTLAVPIVKKGCIGIWDEPLDPGRYYLNEIAYNITSVNTRVQTWNYKGGYKRRFIDLEVGEDGRIKQTEREENVPVPKTAVESAILVRVEGWLVPQEIRIQVQVEPRDAPHLVASVGNIDEAENKIVTPALRSVSRNVTAGAKVLSLINENRSELEERMESAIYPEGRKAGVTIKDLRLVDSVVPPELLVARLRQQLATQLKSTYKQEKSAQHERITTEKARAEADQQPELIRSEIAKTVANNMKIARKRDGEGDKLYLLELAKGEKARVAVLGEEKVYQLAVLKEVLAAAIKNPAIVKNPHILVSGNGGGWEGAAAILGDSTLTRGILGSNGGTPPKARDDKVSMNR